MTYARREEILSKEIITTRELAELFDVDISTASKILCNIKRATGDRLGGVKGKVHIQDYIDYYRLPYIRRIEVI